MSAELKLYMFIGRHLPPVPHATAIINRLLKPIYLRKPRPDVTAEVLGTRMRLTPSECVDGGLLFYPHLYERDEIRFLRLILRPGDTFLDVGANIGLYTLVASRLVGETGRVVSIEADPFNYCRLVGNLELNGVVNVQPLQAGVSDKRETLRLGLNTTGNRGGHSFLNFESAEYVYVECHPLASLLQTNGVTKVRGAKIDIEGFEFRVLRQFFEEAEPTLHPGFFIIEYGVRQAAAGGNVIALLQEQGYRVDATLSNNCLLQKKSRPRSSIT